LFILVFNVSRQNKKSCKSPESFMNFANNQYSISSKISNNANPVKPIRDPRIYSAEQAKKLQTKIAKTHRKLTKRIFPNTFSTTNCNDAIAPNAGSCCSGCKTVFQTVADILVALFFGPEEAAVGTALTGVIDTCEQVLSKASEKVMDTIVEEIEYNLSTIGLKNLWNVMFGPLKNLFDSLDAKKGIGGCAFPKFVPVGIPGAAIQNKDTTEKYLGCIIQGLLGGIDKRFNNDMIADGPDNKPVTSCLTIAKLFSEIIASYLINVIGNNFNWGNMLDPENYKNITKTAVFGGFNALKSITTGFTEATVDVICQLVIGCSTCTCWGGGCKQHSDCCQHSDGFETLACAHAPTGGGWCILKSGLEDCDKCIDDGDPCGDITNKDCPGGDGSVQNCGWTYAKGNDQCKSGMCVVAGDGAQCRPLCSKPWGTISQQPCADYVTGSNLTTKNPVTGLEIAGASIPICKVCGPNSIIEYTLSDSCEEGGGQTLNPSNQIDLKTPIALPAPNSNAGWNYAIDTHFNRWSAWRYVGTKDQNCDDGRTCNNGNGCTPAPGTTCTNNSTDPNNWGYCKDCTYGCTRPGGSLDDWCCKSNENCPSPVNGACPPKCDPATQNVSGTAPNRKCVNKPPNPGDSCTAGAGAGSPDCHGGIACALWNDKTSDPGTRCCRTKNWTNAWLKGWCIDLENGDSCIFDDQCKSGKCSGYRDPNGICEDQERST
jgi:hypothetical protein